MTDLPDLPRLLVADAVRAALKEDLGRAGDITSDATIPADVPARAVIASRRPGVLAGLALAECAFREVDPAVGFVALRRDGDRLKRRDVVAEIEGPARAILGGEYTIAILGDRALPIVKIEPTTEFYDYDAKYLRDDTAYRCPCGLPESLERELGEQALYAFRVLGGRGWGRVDLLMDHVLRGETRQSYVLEVNTSPGMTDHSLVPMAARAAGIPYDELVVRVLALASLG